MPLRSYTFCSRVNKRVKRGEIERGGWKGLRGRKISRENEMLLDMKILGSFGIYTYIYIYMSAYTYLHIYCFVVLREYLCDVFFSFRTRGRSIPRAVSWRPNGGGNTYIYTYMHVYMHAYMRIYIHTFIFAYI